MASSVLPPTAAVPRRSFLPAISAPISIGLTAFAIVLMHGYHPHADDAALYVAGIKHLSDRTLYSNTDVPYLGVHGRSSLFEPVVAAIVRISRQPVDVMLFAGYLVSVVLYLTGAYWLSIRLFRDKLEQSTTVLLAAAAYTLPIAGTSIVVMDPYLTARSFSGPFSLFAIEALLSGGTLRAVSLTALVAAFHPVMGLSLILFQIALFICLQTNLRMQRRLLAIFVIALVVACAFVDLAAAHSPVSQLYRSVVWTRSYLFLSRWQWYEYFGVLAPIMISAWVWSRSKVSPLLRRLCAAIVIAGVTTSLVSLIFVRPSGPLLLARAQTLRVFHPIYLVGIVMLGGWLGSLYNRGYRAAVLFHVAVAASLFCGQRYVYSGRLHLEVPYRSEPNPWHQGFLWVSRNTPRQALFAADPHMIELPEEGEEGFRATAERSILADDKDGGVATLSPILADRWTSQYKAQANLALESDGDRISHLAPFGVSWIILPPAALTQFGCPFRNEAMKVCLLAPVERATQPEAVVLMQPPRILHDHSRR